MWVYNIFNNYDTYADEFGCTLESSFGRHTCKNKITAKKNLMDFSRFFPNFILFMFCVLVQTNRRTNRNTFLSQNLYKWPLLPLSLLKVSAQHIFTRARKKMLKTRKRLCAPQFKWLMLNNFGSAIIICI